jgi:hypothetical protein
MVGGVQPTQRWITLVKLLLGKGAKLETEEGLLGRTPLWWAKWNRHEVVVKLLQKGAEKSQ